MKIARLDENDVEAFDKLALNHGTIFNTSDWIKLFNKGISRHGIYNKGNELIGGFITYQEKKFGLSFYRNPPYTPEVGPFLRIDASNPVSVMDLWKETLTLTSNYLDKLPYSVISLSLNKNVLDMQPFIWDKFKVIPGYTYIIDLSMSLDEILKRMSNERRKNINKGLKDGLLVKEINNYEVIKSLAIQTFSRQDMEVNESYLNRILFKFANRINSFAFGTFANDKPIACTFCVYDKNSAYYLIGGYDNENKHHGAGALSMWEAIKYSKKIGLRAFDFEGSMVPQIERYFRGFGGQLTPYYRINKAKLPLEILLKFYKREMF
jgi:hypothetical protein